MRLAIDSYPARVRLSASLVSELGQTQGVLRTTAERRASAVIIHVGGEVDAANELTFKRLLGEAAAATTAPGLLVVDADALEFMGCCAFTALADEADRCRARGIDLCLVSRNAIVSRIIAAGRLGSRLQVHPDVETALSAVGIDYSNLGDTVQESQ